MKTWYSKKKGGEQICKTKSCEKIQHVGGQYCGHRKGQSKGGKQSYSLKGEIRLKCKNGIYSSEKEWGQKTHTDIWGSEGESETRLEKRFTLA